MVLPQSAPSELLDAFRAGDGADLVRDAVRVVLQELVEMEASDRIGAGRYERTDARVTDRKGTRPRSSGGRRRGRGRVWWRFLVGESIDTASRVAGCRSTGYRWLRRRFLDLREHGIQVRLAARQLRVSPRLAGVWERQRRQAGERKRRERDAAQRWAVRESARHAELPRRRAALGRRGAATCGAGS